MDGQTEPAVTPGCEVRGQGWWGLVGECPRGAGTGCLLSHCHTICPSLC